MNDIAKRYFAPSQLDSDRFSLKIYRGRQENIDARALARELMAANVDIGVIRLPAGKSASIHELARWSMPVIHADTLVYYRCDLGSHTPRPLRNNDLVFSLAGTNDLEELRPLIAETFSGYTSHYHANHMLPADKITAGYQEWAERHASDAGKTLWLARRNGALAAFAACETGDDGSVEGILYGVAPADAGGGVYGDLIRHTQAVARASGARWMKVSTQVNNFAVQKVWAREGFHLYQAWDTFHVNSLLSAGPAIYEGDLIFTAEQIARFAQTSGDENPIHVDVEAARRMGFSAPIAHGVMTLAEISRILGTQVPGPGTIISHFDIAFARPIVAHIKYDLRITSPGEVPGNVRTLVAQIRDEDGNLCVLARPTILLPRK